MTTAAPDHATLTPELTAALVRDDGLAFCRFLHEIYFEELRTGTVATAGRPFVAQARALGLLDSRGDTSRMTTLGYEVANVAKEYVHWIDGGRPLPGGVTPAMVAGKRVLDVGCSFGRHSLNFTLHGARVWGIEFQHTYLQLSRPFAARHGVGAPKVARARAEQLPFADRSFDVVFCRLVINYVSTIAGTLDEFVRVLRPGGVVVLIVDPIAVPLRAVLTHKWQGNARTIAFTLFGLLNTAVLQTTGRQLTIRRRGRMHVQQSPAWPTSGWFTRQLRRRGIVAVDGASLELTEHPGTYVGRLQKAQ